MLTIPFFLKTLIDLYILALLLRIWMQWACCNFENPLAQFIIKITQPVISPLHRIIHAIGLLDSPSLLPVFILAMIKIPLVTCLEMHTFILDPVYLLAGLLTLLKAAGTLVFWVVIIRLLLSKVSQNNSLLELMLHQLSEPLMYPIRRILPPKDSIDFSAIIIILILYLFNYLSIDLFPEIWYRL